MRCTGRRRGVREAHVVQDLKAVGRHLLAEYRGVEEPAQGGAERPGADDDGCVRLGFVVGPASQAFAGARARPASLPKGGTPPATLPGSGFQGFDRPVGPSRGKC